MKFGYLEEVSQTRSLQDERDHHDSWTLTTNCDDPPSTTTFSWTFTTLGFVSVMSCFLMDNIVIRIHKVLLRVSFLGGSFKYINTITHFIHPIFPKCRETKPPRVSPWKNKQQPSAPTVRDDLQIQRSIGQSWQASDKQTLGGVVYDPFPVTMTTRIIPFLLGNPYKPLFVTVTGRWPYPREVYILIQLSKTINQWLIDGFGSRWLGLMLYDLYDFYQVSGLAWWFGARWFWDSKW